MSNLRDEILKLTINELETRVANIMLEINITLSKPENIQEIIQKMADLTTRLSIAEGALNQAKSFYAQTLKERVDILSQLSKNEFKGD
jgi:hypothetical protein